MLERRRWRARRVAALGAAWLALASYAGAQAPALAPAIDPLRERPGAALRAGVIALRAGKAGEAAAILAEVARRHPLVADHATLLRVRALLDAERPDDAIAVARSFERERTSSPLLPRVQELLGDVFAELGDDAAARTAWQAALDGGSENRATLRYALARCYARSGDREAAVRFHLDLWRTNPGAWSDAESEAELKRLGRELGRTLPTPQDRVARGDALFRAFDNEGALAAYDRALADALPAKQRAAVARQRAHTLFRLRRYDQAAEAFAALGDDAETRFWRARCLARQGRIADSIEAFERIGAERGSFARQARFLAATLLEGEGDVERARAHYAEVVERGDSPEQRLEARWRLGWLAYRGGELELAAQHFARLGVEERDPVDALRARYWEARAREALGDPEAAGRLRAIAVEYPLSYYGWRAATRVAGDELRREPPLPAPAQPLSLDPRGLDLARALLEAELPDEAERELRRLAGGARHLDDRVELARLFAEAQAFDRAQRVVLDVYAAGLARGPTPGREELWWLAWPRVYEDGIADATAPVAGVPPELVLAVMREESGYRPAVVSPVGARGLLQIMPATGRRLAADLGLTSFDAAELFEPRTNLRLGTRYLGELLERFGGRTSAAVAGYNAGEGAVERWLRERPELSDDEWVEAIPYDQTRAYVRRVLRSLHAYRVLY